MGARLGNPGAGAPCGGTWSTDEGRVPGCLKALLEFNLAGDLQLYGELPLINPGGTSLPRAWGLHVFTSVLVHDWLMPLHWSGVLLPVTHSNQEQH